MNSKHYDNLVTIAVANGVFSCALDAIGEMGYLVQEIVETLDKDKTGLTLKKNETVAEVAAYVYNALDALCIACGIEDMMQDAAEKLAEETVLRMMENAK